MQIEINKAKVKAMVSLLRKQIVPGMPSSKAYETVSHLLGYPNWDTLSGLIGKGKQKFSERSGLSDKQMRWTQRHGWRAQAPVVREPFTVFVQANNTNEWADGPGWVKWVVDQEFVDLLQKVHTQCLENDNSHIAVDWLPEQWGNDETLRLQGDTLNVSCSFFYLSAHPKYGPGPVESLGISFKDFYAALDGGALPHSRGWADGVLFVDGNSPKELALDLLYEGIIEVNESTIDQMS